MNKRLLLPAGISATGIVGSMMIESEATRQARGDKLVEDAQQQAMQAKIDYDAAVKQLKDAKAHNVAISLAKDGRTGIINTAQIEERVAKYQSRLARKVYELEQAKQKREDLWKPSGGVLDPVFNKLGFNPQTDRDEIRLGLLIGSQVLAAAVYWFWARKGR